MLLDLVNFFVTASPLRRFSCRLHLLVISDPIRKPLNAFSNFTVTQMRTLYIIGERKRIVSSTPHIKFKYRRLIFNTKSTMASSLSASSAGVSLEHLELYDGEEVAHHEKVVELWEDGKMISGAGSLTITSERVVFKSDESDASKDMEVRYPQIVLHAISRLPPMGINVTAGAAEPDGTPSTIANEGSPASAAADDEKESCNDNDDDDDVPCIEIHLVPSVEASLQTIFKHMTDMAALHPDESIDDDNEEALPGYGTGFPGDGWIMAGDAAAMEDLSDDDEEE